MPAVRLTDHLQSGMKSGRRKKCIRIYYFYLT